MNKFESITKPLAWFMALLLTAFIAGCGGNDGVPAANPPPGASSSTVLPGVAGTTGANATNPTVISASPANLATNVVTSTNSWNGTINVVTGKLVTATFNAAMAPATITAAGTFTLKTTTAGTNVPGTVTMNAANTVATFTPTATALVANTSYTATVTTAAKNTGSVTAMPKTVAWSFTTNATVLTGQAPVNLKTAGDFTILAQTAITLNDSTPTVTTVVTGDVGISPNGNTSVTGANFTKTQDGSLDFWTSPEVVAVSGVTGSGRIYMSDDAGGGASSVGAGVTIAKVLQAKLDVIAAYNDAAGRTPATASGTFLDRNGGSLDGQTLVPGTYTWTGNVTSTAASTVTLSGGPDDVWIFQVQGFFAPGATSNMILSNPTVGGALPQAKNIFWAVAGTNVTLGAGAHMEGVILTSTGYITLGIGATVNGRLLSQTAVTVDAGGTVTPPAP